MTGHAAGTLPDHAAAVAASFGLGVPVEDMVIAARGEQGRVWRLVTGSGPVAVKELLVRQLEVDASADVAYQEAVLANGSVPMPRPRRSPSGEVLAEIGGHQVRVYEWVELLRMDRLLDPNVVGATVAAIHRVQFEPARAQHWWYTDPVGGERWRQLLGQASAQQTPFAEALAAEIPNLLALEELIEKPTSLQSCHRDLWADNILATAQGGVCVIDWENCGLADPAQELPMILLDFGAGDADRVRRLYRAYVEAGGPARLCGRGSFTMVIAQFGHFWESAVQAYLAPGATEEAKAHSLERIAELVDTPLRLDDIDAMLDIITAGP